MNTNSEKSVTPPNPPVEWQGSPESSSVLPRVSLEPELTTLPLTTAIFKLAGPAMASMFFIMIFNLADIWWVGQLGPVYVAGVSAASFILWALHSVATCVSTGINALVARYVGARNCETASAVISQGLLLAILLALFFGAFGLMLQKPTFISMGLATEVQRAASDYMIYIIYGLVVIFAFFAIDAAFRGMGDTKTPLKIVSAGLTFNIILDPFLIFGIGPFPRLEAGGAALATILSHLLILVWGTVLLQRRAVRLVYDRRRQALLEPGLLWRIVKIGAPIAFSGFMFSVSYMFLTRVITQFGSGALAALGLGHRIEGLAFFASLGFSVAAATLVGQNLGAEKPDRAEKAAWLTLFYISVLLIIVSLVFYTFARQIMTLFIRDSEVIEEGVRYLRIIAFFEVFLGSEVVLEGAFGGAGNSVPPMVVSVPLTWARIPLALFLAHALGLGSSGVWWAIAVTTGLKGIIMAFWFKKNRWKLKEV